MKKHPVIFTLAIVAAGLAVLYLLIEGLENGISSALASLGDLIKSPFESLSNAASSAASSVSGAVSGNNSFASTPGVIPGVSPPGDGSDYNFYQDAGYVPMSAVDDATSTVSDALSGGSYDQATDSGDPSEDDGS